jgi:hypothetical protein
MDDHVRATRKVNTATGTKKQTVIDQFTKKQGPRTSAATAYECRQHVPPRACLPTNSGQSQAVNATFACAAC